MFSLKLWLLLTFCAADKGKFAVFGAKTGFEMVVFESIIGELYTHGGGTLLNSSNLKDARESSEALLASFKDATMDDNCDGIGES